MGVVSVNENAHNQLFGIWVLRESMGDRDALINPKDEERAYLLSLKGFPKPAKNVRFLT